MILCMGFSRKLDRGIPLHRGSDASFWKTGRPCEETTAPGEATETLCKTPTSRQGHCLDFRLVLGQDLKRHVSLATGTSQLMSPAQPCFSAFPCCAAHSSSAARTALAWALHPAHWSGFSPHPCLPSSLSVAAAQA